jgi:hypothetical protein
VYGDTQVARGLPPEIYGAAGVVKFPHGVVIHAIQGLPFIAWAARRAGLGDRTRTLIVAIATAASALLLSYALAQTLAGRPRFGVQEATTTHAIGDAEGIRDWNLRAVFGAWNAMNNGDGAAKHTTGVLPG